MGSICTKTSKTSRAEGATISWLAGDSLSPLYTWLSLFSLGARRPLYHLYLGRDSLRLRLEGTREAGI